MFVNVEETPNPNTLKFIPEKNIKVDKSYIFNKNDSLHGNKLLETLFEVEGIDSLLIDESFISITKSNNSSWELLRTVITSKLGSYLENNNNSIIIKKEKIKKSEEIKKLVPLEEKICELLDTRVKPVVASHGGEISFHSFKDGVVFLELKGSCSGCPSSTATLKMGIENMLKHYIPDVKEVVELSN